MFICHARFYWFRIESQDRLKEMNNRRDLLHHMDAAGCM